jgi:hypothetical protein
MNAKPKKALRKPRIDGKLLGPCMIYCGYCGVYRSGVCDGCGPMMAKRAKEGKVFCGLAACAKERKLVMCADCEDYPCDRFDEGQDDAALYSKEFVAYLRKNSGRNIR